MPTFQIKYSATGYIRPLLLAAMVLLSGCGGGNSPAISQQAGQNSPQVETAAETVSVETDAQVDFSPLAAQVEVSPSAATAADWDVDKDGSVEALTDGLLFLRYSSGFRGQALVSGAVSLLSALSVADVEANLEEALAIADIDGNNQVESSTDGLLLVRYLFGLSGDALISDAISPDASRTTAAEISQYILDHMPSSDSSGGSTGGGEDSSSGVASQYCSTQVYHLNDDAHTDSAINLTIENSGSNSLQVSITSADNSPVNQVLVESQTGASITTDASAVPDTFIRVLSWSGASPVDETLNILWAKPTGGMWIVRDISVPFEAVCSGSGGGAGGNTDGTSDGTADGGTDEGSDGSTDDNPDGGTDGDLSDGGFNPPSLQEISVANGLLVGGADSSKPQFVVYVFDNDLNAPGSSNCNGGCASAWPPVYVTDDMPSGVVGLGSIERVDGSSQVTFNDRPLYFYVGDQQPGQTNGDGIPGWHKVEYGTTGALVNLYNESTPLEPVASFVRDDGVVVTRIADRGRDRHAKDSAFQDHYDHYLAHYWEYRTMRIQLEDYVPTGQSKITATWITEAELGAREFRVWYAGDPTVTGKFFFNPPSAPQGTNDGVVYHGSGTWNDDFEKISDQGGQHKYTLDITSKWQLVGPFPSLTAGTNMDFEISMFLQNPPAGSRLNYYGTSFVYIIGQPGVEPFEWQPYQLDGTPIPSKGLSGGKTTLGYNYTNEPAGRFMQMATNMSPGNGQPFVRGRRLHHTSFVDGIHGERHDNPVWTEQAGKAGNHYVNESCAACHVRNGRALVEDVGVTLNKWVFKVADENSNPMATIGSVLQPSRVSGSSEGSVSLGPWIEHANGLRSPNYRFSPQVPPRFSARIAPQLVGIGLLEAVDESTIMAWADPDDINGDGISGRASVVEDKVNGVQRLGRFGYKASTFSVKHHVSSALNTDMGVMTAMMPEPDCGSQQTSCGSPGAELAEDHVDDLVKYVSLLGVGARRDYNNQAGENLFAETGCAGCHRPSMVTSQYHPLAELRSQTIYPYTDMLLHDMGEGLADNLGEGVASGAEWRTAPLWGLGLAKNVMLGDEKGNDLVSMDRRQDDINRIGYLHDGRARTIDEAIRWHGGEAQNSKEAYEDLSTESRNLLLEFLESL